MFSFRRTIITATALLGAVAVGEAQAQTPVDPRFKTPTEMAKAIAHTIDVSAPKNTLNGPNGPIMGFESATSHENIVEIRYIVRDVAVLAKLKATIDNYKRNIASFFCKGERISYINAGVEIHNVTEASDGHDRIEVTIGRSTCASLPPPPELADSKTLSEMARVVAQTENNASARSPNGPFHFDAATAHEGVVELRFIVADATAGQSIGANRAQLVGLGYRSISSSTSMTATP